MRGQADSLRSDLQSSNSVRAQLQSQLEDSVRQREREVHSITVDRDNLHSKVHVHWKKSYIANLTCNNMSRKVPDIQQGLCTCTMAKEILVVVNGYPSGTICVFLWSKVTSAIQCISLLAVSL